MARVENQLMIRLQKLVVDAANVAYTEASVGGILRSSATSP